MRGRTHWVVVLVAAVLLLGGCDSGDQEGPQRPPSPQGPQSPEGPKGPQEP